MVAMVETSMIVSDIASISSHKQNLHVQYTSEFGARPPDSLKMLAFYISPVMRAVFQHSTP